MASCKPEYYVVAMVSAIYINRLRQMLGSYDRVRCLLDRCPGSGWPSTQTTGCACGLASLAASVQMGIFQLAIDAHNNVNIIVAGYTYGSMFDNTSNGGTDAFLGKFDQNGTMLWYRQYMGRGRMTSRVALASTVTIVTTSMFHGVYVTINNDGNFEGYTCTYAQTLAQTGND